MVGRTGGLEQAVFLHVAILFVCMGIVNVPLIFCSFAR
jgi:hypothetical protein